MGPACPTSWLLPSVRYVHDAAYVVPGARDAHGARNAHGAHGARNAHGARGAHGAHGARHLATAPYPWDVTNPSPTDLRPHLGIWRFP